jgi:sugar lactone lactonase YvrE
LFRSWRPAGALIACAAGAACASAPVGAVSLENGARAASQSSVGEPAPWPDDNYYVVVAAESQDEVSVIRFGPDGGQLVESVEVGLWLTETDGPHGIAVDPDGSHWYVSIAHGTPFGQVHRYDIATNERVGMATVGLFPASMAISDGGLLFVVNFNLHGDPVPSSVSVVDTESMQEIAQIPTCAMPHGARLSANQTRLYLVCVRDEQLVELDTRSLAVTRRMYLGPHAEQELDASILEARAELGTNTIESMATRCGPTWVHPSPDGRRAYVACNKNREVLEIDLEEWTIARRFETGAGPYNLDVTPDGGRLVVTYKGGSAIGVFDLKAGRELAAIQTHRTLPHGVALSPDSRYGFVSVEGVGGEPGTVEMIDLTKLATVGRVDMGKQAGGISFWKTEIGRGDR